MRLTCILLFLSFCFTGLTQERVIPEQDTQKQQKVQILYAEFQRSLLVDGDYHRFLEGNVQIEKDSSYFYCDTAKITKDYLLAWGNVSMIKGDSIEIFADSIFYDIRLEEADIYHNVHLKNGNQLLFSDFIHYDDKVDIATYTNKALIKNDSIEVKSKRGIYKLNESLAIFSNKVSVKSKDFDLYADTLLYDLDGRVAIFQGPTDIVQSGNRIHTNAGHFNIETQSGIFLENPEFTGEDGAKSKGDSIRVNGLEKIVELMGQASFQTENTTATGDYIKYEDLTQDVTILGNGYINDDNQIVRSENIYYNRKTKLFRSDGRSSVDANGINIQANQLDAQDSLGIATGNVSALDTVNNIQLDGSQLIFNQKTKDFILTGGTEQALMRTSMDESDSLFIVSDTLNSQEYIRVDSLTTTRIDTIQVDSTTTLFDTIQTTNISKDTIRHILAYHHVRIFSTDFQAKADSMSFNTKDSVITLFHHPVIWSDTSQFFSDTIIIRLKNKKVSQIELRKNSLILNTPDYIFYNQIKGKNATAYLSDNSIDRLFIKGNAQSIYYIQDDLKKYIAVNQTDCSEMTLFFKENKIDSIDFNTVPTSNMYPMKQTNHEALKLEGFEWLEHLRPLRKEDLHPILISANMPSGQKNRDN